MDNLLNVNQAAFILKVHPLTIRRYIKEGKLQAQKAGGNIRIKETELLQFNKDFTPQHQENTSPFRMKIRSAKTFLPDDPFFRLKGRGASLHLSGS